MARLLSYLMTVLAAIALSAGADAQTGDAIPDATLEANRDATLTESLTAAEDGWYHFAYAARRGVAEHDDHVVIIDGEVSRDDCGGDGLAHVALKIEDGEVWRLRLRTGCKPRRLSSRTHDLGEVPAAEAVAYLLPLAQGEATGKDGDVDEEIAEDAIAALSLADAETWRPLLAIARDDGRSGDVRQAAVFWVGQQAGDKVAGELEAIATDDDEDLELREQAVFALSQTLGDEGVDVLGRIATENNHPEVRRQALFWLAQRDDPAVIDLFERILLE